MSLFTDLRDVLTPYAQRINGLKADLGDLTALETEDKTDLVSAINEAAESGLSDEAKAALLACFEQAAWTDDDGEQYYNALVQALGGAGNTPIYRLPAPVVFDGTNDVDTGEKFTWGKIYTLLIEYVPSTIDSNIRSVFCAIDQSATKYVALQVGNHWSTGAKTVWGVGLAQPSDRTANISVNSTARHVIVIDLTGSNVADKATYIHYYRNVTNNAYSNTTTVYEGVTRSDVETYQNIKLGSSAHANIYNFIGTISKFLLYKKELSSGEINSFLLNG